MGKTRILWIMGAFLVLLYGAAMILTHLFGYTDFAEYRMQLIVFMLGAIIITLYLREFYYGQPTRKRK